MQWIRSKDEQGRKIMKESEIGVMQYMKNKIMP